MYRLIVRILRYVGCIVLAAGLLMQWYLRFYPLVRSGCSWPSYGQETTNTDVRIIAFGDPQITGYSRNQDLRKRIDIFGNDLFLRQIAATNRRLRKPDYVAVMGDLLSSQWIPTNEFHQRVDRYEKIFPQQDPGKVLNVSGNHDIGYHGEINDERVNRFVERFGELNFLAASVKTPQNADLYRIVVLNSLCLDGPPHNDTMQLATKEFLQDLTGYSGSTVLLMHIPLYKPAGICKDGPSFEYYGENFGHTLRQQNHLSEESSQLILNSVFKGGNGGIIVTGHDHFGCSTKYFQVDGENWAPRAGMANNDASEEDLLCIDEFTVKSMMGEFGGNSGYISGHLEPDNRMRWSHTLCQFHIQHIWWVAQVVSIIGLIWVPVSWLL